jgi:Tfp pilus assembly protein PilO
MSPFEVIAFGVLIFGFVKIFNGPVAKALADRLRGRPQAGSDEAVIAELQAVQARLAEVEERLDFAERLLARGREAEQLSRGAHP